MTTKRGLCRHCGQTDGHRISCKYNRCNVCGKPATLGSLCSVCEGKSRKRAEEGEGVTAELCDSLAELGLPALATELRKRQRIAALDGKRDHGQ